MQSLEPSFLNKRLAFLWSLSRQPGSASSGLCTQTSNHAFVVQITAPLIQIREIILVDKPPFFSKLHAKLIIFYVACLDVHGSGCVYDITN